MPPPFSAAIWQIEKERDSLQKKLWRQLFADEDSCDENFECGCNLDIIPYSENVRDSESSDLDIQIEGSILEECIEPEGCTGKNCNEITL